MFQAKGPGEGGLRKVHEGGAFFDALVEFHAFLAYKNEIWA